MRFVPHLLSLQLIVLGTTVSAQTGVLSPQLTVFNNLNSTAGSNGLTLTTGDTPSLFLIRSVGAWSDTWWQWTMGTDNKLRLGFSSVPQLTFQNGALGIGTENPENRFHVGDGDVRISRASGSWGPNLLLDATKVGTGGVLWGITSATSSDMAGAGRLSFVANGAQHVVITANGNLGIGTASPLAKLNVEGWADHTNGNVLISGNEAPTLFLRNTNGGLVTQIMSWDGAGNDSLAGARIGTRSRSSKSAHVLFTTDDNIRMIVRDDGNVGIGTTNPTHKLAVNGTIKAKEVIVETSGWSDYVFAEDYALTPLAEVEAHIKEHKHLPGIPSAVQVAEQGVSVGEMQARLLAKVEELTLYQIELEKRLASQAVRIDTLERENKRLQTRR